MKSERVNIKNRTAAKAFSSAFENDGIPNGPFKSSQSAAFAFAMIGIVFGVVLIVCGTFGAIQKSMANNAPVQIVQQTKIAAPVRIVSQVSLASADNGRKRPHHSGKQHAKKQKKQTAAHGRTPG
jgi:hypothetical protein